MKITGEAKVSLHLTDMDQQDVNHLYYGLLNVLESRLDLDEKAAIEQLTKAVGKCVNTLGCENGIKSVK